MTLTLNQRRKKQMRQFQKNIEAQIFMLDDPESLMILGSMYLTATKDIFLAQYSKEKTREVMMAYINEVTT